MQLTLREAARYLDVSESTARRWIGEARLPVHHANERLYLNAVELWEWAVEHGVPVSRRLLDHARERPGHRAADVRAAARRRHLLRHRAAPTRRDVLREFVARLPLPPEQDRETLLSVLEAREAMGSTGIGDGIAIPHVRNPIVLHVDAPFVTLCLLRHPVDFDAMDGQPVHALFMVVSPTVPVHLRILGQLGFLLRRRHAPDDAPRSRLRRGDPRRGSRCSRPRRPRAPSGKRTPCLRPARREGAPLVSLFLAALALIVLGSMAACVFRRHPLADPLYVALVLAGCAIGVLQAVAVLAGTVAPSLTFHSFVPGGSWSLGVDPLSAIFLVAIFAVGAASGAFGKPYLAGERDHRPTWFVHATVALLVVVSHSPRDLSGRQADPRG